MFFLSGVALYLFVPLAEAVIFAMIASYILSRTLVPTMAMFLLKPKAHNVKSRNPLVKLQQLFERGFEALRNSYRGLLVTLVETRSCSCPAFLGLCAAAFLLVPFLGQDFFPTPIAVNLYRTCGLALGRGSKRRRGLRLHREEHPAGDAAGRGLD